MIPNKSIEDHISQLHKTTQAIEGFYISDTSVPLNVVDQPHRSEFYAINVTLKGKAVCHSNLNEYHLQKNTIITLPPEVVRSWTERSADYSGLKVFFTREFYNGGLGNSRSLESFSFFQTEAIHAFKISEEAYGALVMIFRMMDNKLSSPHQGMEDIIRKYVKILLLEIEEMYKDISAPQDDSTKNRGLVLLDEFKRLVSQNYLTERSVSAYADMLFITPSHLSNTIKEVSGKTPTEIIEEMLLLDAQVMLRQTDKPINEIADHLGFNDPSYFGKFFKKHINTTPAAYRKTSSGNHPFGYKHGASSYANL